MQCICFITSFPFLIYWSLPFSLLTFIGNIIFLPFIILFLIISFFYSLSLLCHIPHSFVTVSIEYIVHFWMYLMSYASDAVLWWCTFNYISLFLWACLIMCLIFPYKKITIPLSIILITGSIIFSPTEPLPAGYSLIKKNGTSILIDAGSSFSSPAKLQLLLQQRRIYTLDYYIFLKFRNKKTADNTQKQWPQCTIIDPLTLKDRSVLWPIQCIYDKRMRRAIASDGDSYYYPTISFSSAIRLAQEPLLHL